ncbi:MAG: peptide ABC transporter substrate-binding protein [Tissierellia bacterium]|jgi:oligopeptide transport system substrate-binding protein|nr:peptide ABC transporter substrate-binding protein [Tissierellia bacterium]
MKRILAGLLIAVFVLISCQGPTGSETIEKDPVSIEPVTQSKRLHFIEKSDPPSLHSWYAADERSFLVLGNIQSGLFNMSAGQEVTNDLVRQTLISKDGRTYTFKLRSADYVNHLGEIVAPITAGDFVYSWKKLADPFVSSPHHGLLLTAGIKGTRALHDLRSRLEEIESQKKRIEELDISDFVTDETATQQQKFRDQQQAMHQNLNELMEVLEEDFGSLAEAEKSIGVMIDQLGIRASDDSTLVVELERSVPFLKELLCFPAFYPINPTFHQAQGSKYATSLETTLFSGPFYLSRWQSNQRFSLEKNPNYWAAYATAIEGVDLSIDRDITNQGLVEAYLNGDVDWSPLSGEMIERYGNRPDARYRLDASVVYVEINQTYQTDRRYRRLLADPEARKAMQMTLDKIKLTDQVLMNGSIPTDSYYPHGFQQLEGRDIRLLYPEYADGYHVFNTNTAEQLWMEAKDKVGLDWVRLKLLVSDSPNTEKVAEFLKTEWERLLPGTSIEIQYENFSKKLDLVNRGNFQLAVSSWTPDYPDVRSFAELWMSHSLHNTTGFADAGYDNLIDQAKSENFAQESRQVERMGLLLEAERVLLEDYQTIIPLYQRGAIDLLNPAIRNLTVQIVGPRYQFKYVSIEEESR